MILLTSKEIAATLRRSVPYIYAMKRRGFKMPGGRATIEDVLSWLNSNPAPFAKTDKKSRKT